MKKKIPAMLSLAIATAICILMSFSVLAATQDTKIAQPITQATEISTPCDTEINPTASTRIFDILRSSKQVMNVDVATSGSYGWNDYFTTTSTNSAYRVWIDNTGSHSIQIYVKRGSADSNDIMAGPFTVGAGKQKIIEMDSSQDPGNRYVVVNPIKGNAIKATVRVQIAPSIAELG